MPDLALPFGLLAVTPIRRHPDHPRYWLTVGPVYTIDSDVNVTRGLAVTGRRRGLAFYCLPRRW